MLAGHDEGGGKVIEKHYLTNEIEGNSYDIGQHELVVETKKFVEFYGMSSKKGNDIHFGGLKDYRVKKLKVVKCWCTIVVKSLGLFRNCWVD